MFLWMGPIMLQNVRVGYIRQLVCWKDIGIGLCCPITLQTVTAGRKCMVLEGCISLYCPSPLQTVTAGRRCMVLEGCISLYCPSTLQTVKAGRRCVVLEGCISLYPLSTLQTVTAGRRCVVFEEYWYQPMLPEHFTDGYARAEVRGRGCFQSSAV